MKNQKKPSFSPEASHERRQYTISNRILPLVLRLFLYAIGLVLSEIVLLMLVAFLYVTFGKAAAIVGVCIAGGLAIFWIFECVRFVIRWRREGRREREDEFSAL